ncbi:MAG: thiolase family protein [Ruminococcaceae bacterium]|nr:thiolase family protein [Oscillospiraceae bacterium]
MKDAVIVSAKRTPMAKYRGDFAAIPVPELGAIPLKAVVEDAGIDPALVDDVIYGNLLAGEVANPARMCALSAGFPDSVPGNTVDRQCASSLNAVAYAASMIQTNMADILIAGGVESYSQAPFFLERPGQAYPNGLKFRDYTSSPKGRGDNIAMIPTAENLAVQYKLTREECDAFALMSQQRASKAWAEGWFDEQVVPVTVYDRKKNATEIKMDACVRDDTTLEGLAKLRPVMPNGVTTAGNASPQNDGATAVLLMSREKAKELGCEVLAVVKEYSMAGVDPTIMGIGPVYSTRKLMDRFGYKSGDFDLIEINEAFAAQSIPCIREMGWDMDKVNVEGGAIAIGHPLAASGGMLVGRMVHALRRRSLKRGLVTFCIGGGQGFSLVLENEQA